MKNDITTNINRGVNIWPIWTSGSSEGATITILP